jgi:cell division protein FtsQ
MNSVSAIIFLGAAGLLALAGLTALARASWFPVRAIQVEGDLTRNGVPTLRAVALPRLSGNFFTLDLQRARASFEAVPWIRRAVVRRVWPDRLAVRLEEHRAVALWEADDADDRLVNNFGEVFQANVGDVEDDNLPQLSGPQGSSARMLLMLDRLNALFARLDRKVDRLVLTGRGSWRAELDSDAAIELGRGTDAEVLERTDRVVRTLGQVVAQYGSPLVHADLRHPDGYAVRLKGVTVPSGPGTARNR